MKLITLPIIVLFCFIIGEIIKILFPSKTKLIKLIPFIMSILGAAMSILIYMLAPQTLEQKNILEVILLGMISGLASTGSNELFKKIKELRGGN